jgi:hypothetical protein
MKLPSNMTKETLVFFEYEHLPDHLQEVSRPFCELANDMAQRLDGTELEFCLRWLLMAKDCAVRAALGA